MPRDSTATPATTKMSNMERACFLMEPPLFTSSLVGAFREELFREGITALDLDAISPCGNNGLTSLDKVVDEI